MIAIWVAPEDPHTRYHAWQGGILVALLYVSLILFGLLGKISDAEGYLAAIGLVSGLVLLAAVVAMVWGIVSAARGHYVRLRPVWDLVAALRS